MAYTTHDVVEKYQNRLNKSDSQDYDNIWWYQIAESYYKGMLEVIREIKKGKTQKKEGDEETSDTVDDLQPLLSSKNLKINDNKVYVETETIPSDYLYYKRITPLCYKGTCTPYYFRSYFKEEANVDELLYDSMSRPSYKFEQTFHTMMGNKFKVYHNQHFTIKEVRLIYYRLPKKPVFDKNKPQTLEFKDDVVEMFIDKGIEILSGDLEILNTKNIAAQRVANEN